MPALGVQVSAYGVQIQDRVNVNLVKCVLFTIFSGDPVNIIANLLCYVNSCAAGREMVHITQFQKNGKLLSIWGSPTHPGVRGYRLRVRALVSASNIPHQQKGHLQVDNYGVVKWADRQGS